MAYEQKPGQGSLFKNESENEKAPKYKGKIMTPDGKLYDIAAWVRQSASGVTYMSLNVQEPRTQEQTEQAPIAATVLPPTPSSATKPAPAKQEFNDLPF